MKTLSPELKAHLQQATTTICTCWKVTRTDGVIYGFTDHDADITFDGLTYSSNVGYTRTAVKTSLDLSVDNMNVIGILNNSYIAEHDLRNGVYNFARVDIFIVNWRDLTMGSMPLRRGWFGEITITPNGYFTTELRGLTQALSIQYGNVIQQTCRNDLGDSKCMIPIDPPIWQANHFYPKGQWIKVPFITGQPASVDPYGGVIWQASVAGASGATPPQWTALVPLADGSTITWTPYNSFTKQGTVLSVANRKSFAVAGLTVPADGLYGPLVGTAGVSYPISGHTLDISHLNTSVGINSTCTITCDGGALFVNTNVTGGGFLQSQSGVSGSQRCVLVGPITSINNIVATGITWQSTTGYLSATISITVTQPGGASTTLSYGVPSNEAYYSNAILFWVTGPNAGKAMEVQTFVNGTINLWLSAAFIPQSGDVFRIYPGCNKTRANCLIFGNVINMHAEPDLPGQDFLYAPNLNF
jgi:hypothetical protein